MYHPPPPGRSSRGRAFLSSFALVDDESSERFVAVGIDFGTTFSGVSWARSTRPKEIHEITGWPSENPRNKSETQVPTLYDIDTGKWGYEVTPGMEPMKWFKLLLLRENDIQKEEIRNSTQLQQARNLLAQSIHRMTAVDIVGAYLRKVWDHSYSELETMMDIEDLPLRVAITIPAIWPAYAHGLMKRAANIAGILKNRDIGKTTLMLVQEPEAAALATLFQHSSFPEIKINESFIVCDAGGGTVDVISYTVVSEQPFQLEECVTGDGESIDKTARRRMLILFKGKAKLRINALTSSEYNQFIQKEWELGAKRAFSNAADPKFFNLHPPSRAYGTFARLRHKETLAINKEEMKGFFNKSLTGIRSLVNSQFNQIRAATGKPPKKILLVGGLGSSEYVYDVLNTQFDNKVLRPSGGWSAVARGAILRLLQDNISSQNTVSTRQQKALDAIPNVTSRRSRYHYGIIATKPAQSVILEPDDEVCEDPEGSMRVTRMNWYLRKGDKVEKGTRIPISYVQFSKGPLPPKCTFEIMYSAEDVAPERPDNKVRYLCRIDCDWDKPIEQWKAVGNPFAGWRKHEDQELTMGLEGEPKWEIRVGSKRAEHDFEVEYQG